MKGTKRKRETINKEESEADPSSSTAKKNENEPLIAADSQKMQLMNMFSQQTLSNYQRQFRPVESQQLSKKDVDSAVDEDQDVTPTEEVSKESLETPTDPNKDDRTLFVGNLPISMDQKAIIKLFKEYGKIETVRFRSIPVAGMKVDKAGDQNLVKKVSAVKHTFGDQKASFNAYIVFEDASAVNSALVENNRVIDGRHIRVDHVNPSLFDPQRTLFLGNLPHRVDEEEVREHFAKILPNGHDDIESIRIIRDPETLIGKGIGYLLLKSRNCLLEALSLHEKEFKKNWKLRVTMCSKKAKKSTSSSNNSSSNNRKRARDQDNTDNSNNHTLSEEERLKKKAKLAEKELTMKNALKRLNLKSVKTKKKLLEERKSKKSMNQKRPNPPPRRSRSSSGVAGTGVGGGKGRGGGGGKRPGNRGKK